MMPILNVCQNKGAHQDQKKLFHLGEKKLFVLSVELPIGDNEGVSFYSPRSTLVAELLHHTQAESVAIRYGLCKGCRKDVKGDINELIAETQKVR